MNRRAVSLIATTALISAGLTVLTVGPASALLVVATTTDLGDFAQQVGGEKVDVHTILQAGQDPHFVRPTPGEQRTLANARVFLQIGLDLEVWAPDLIAGARNPNLLIQTCSKGMQVLEKPAGGVTPAQGDVHPAGNPHIMLNPTNAKIAVSNILAALSAASPRDKDYFKNRAGNYITQVLDPKITAWAQAMKPYAGTKFVAFHNSWPYFAHRFTLNLIGFVEPVPGVPPGARDLARLEDLMKQQHVKVIVTEPFYPRDTVETIARATGAKIVDLAGYPGALAGTGSYVTMMDHDVNAFINALK